VTSLDGKRVRRWGRSYLGTVSIDVGGDAVHVRWDASPKWHYPTPRAELIVVPDDYDPTCVPPEARPESVGALASLERRHR
jgi:hypothetical protein